MLFELFGNLSFLSLTAVMIAAGLGWYFLSCGGLYLALHRSRHAATVHKWRTQRTWPTPAQVKGEVRDGTICMSMASVVVATSLWMGINGYGGLYSNPGEHSLWYIPVSIFLVFVVMEVYEWFFHWASHRVPLLWRIHKHHHTYSNPTAFGVMADQPVDMLFKASPILWLPFLFPVWDVALLGTFVLMNFIYGTYLHAGFDFGFMPSPHSRFLVSAWHHNEHHAGAVDHNYGFFTGFMDLLFKTRFTPDDKVATRSKYRCTECRNVAPEPQAPVEVAA